MLCSVCKRLQCRKLFVFLSYALICNSLILQVHEEEPKSALALHMPGSGTSSQLHDGMRRSFRASFAVENPDSNDDYQPGLPTESSPQTTGVNDAHVSLCEALAVKFWVNQHFEAAKAASPQYAPFFSGPCLDLVKKAKCLRFSDLSPVIPAANPVTRSVAVPVLPAIPVPPVPSEKPASPLPGDDTSAILSPAAQKADLPSVAQSLDVSGTPLAKSLVASGEQSSAYRAGQGQKKLLGVVAVSPRSPEPSSPLPSPRVDEKLDNVSLPNAAPPNSAGGSSAMQLNPTTPQTQKDASRSNNAVLSFDHPQLMWYFLARALYKSVKSCITEDGQVQADSGGGAPYAGRSMMIGGSSGMDLSSSIRDLGPEPADDETPVFTALSRVQENSEPVKPIFAAEVGISMMPSDLFQLPDDIMITFKSAAKQDLCKGLDVPLQHILLVELTQPPEQKRQDYTELSFLLWVPPSHSDTASGLKAKLASLAFTRLFKQYSKFTAPESPYSVVSSHSHVTVQRTCFVSALCYCPLISGMHKALLMFLSDYVHRDISFQKYLLQVASTASRSKIGPAAATAVRNAVVLLVHSGVSLASCNLEEANLSGAHLQGAQFDGVSLAGADLSRCILQDTHMNKALLRKSKMYDVYLAAHTTLSFQYPIVHLASCADSSKVVLATAQTVIVLDAHGNYIHTLNPAINPELVSKPNSDTYNAPSPTHATSDTNLTTTKNTRGPIVFSGATPGVDLKTIGTLGCPPISTATDAVPGSVHDLVDPVPLLQSSDTQEIFSKPVYTEALKFTAVCFSVDGSWIAASSDKHIFVWALAPLKLIAIVCWSGRVTSLQCMPDAASLIFCTTDGSLVIWPLPLLAAPSHQISRGTGDVYEPTSPGSPRNKWKSRAQTLKTMISMRKLSPRPLERSISMSQEGSMQQPENIRKDPMRLPLHSAPAVSCAICHTFPLPGPYYKCKQCTKPVYLCNSCTSQHEPHNQFIYLEGSSDQPRIMGFQCSEFTTSVQLRQGCLVAAGSDHCLWVLKHTGELVKRLSGHTKNINAMAASPDRKYLVTCSADYSVRLWDMVEHSMIAFAEHDHQQAITSVDINATSEHAISASLDHLFVWILPSMTKFLSVTPDVPSPCVCFGPKERQFLTGASNGTVSLWSYDQEGSLLSLPGPESDIQSTGVGVSVATDPVFLLKCRGSWVIACIKSQVLVWNMSPKIELLFTVEHPSNVTSVAISTGQGKFIAVGCEGGSLHVHSRAINEGSHETVSHAMESMPAKVSGLDFDDTNTSLVASCLNGVIGVYEFHEESTHAAFGVLRGKCRNEWKELRTGDDGVKFGLCPCSQYIAPGTFSDMCQCAECGCLPRQHLHLEAPCRIQLRNMFNLQLLSLHFLEVTYDGKFAICNGYSSSIWVVNLSTLSLHTTLVGDRPPSGCSLSADASLVAYCSEESCNILLMSVETSAVVHELVGHSSGVVVSKFSPDSHLIASGGQDGQVFTWSSVSGFAIHTISSCTSPIVSLSFLNSNALLFSSGDGLHLHPLSSIDYKEQLHGVPHGKAVTAAFVTSDDKYMLTGSADTTIRIWLVSCGRLLRTLHGHTKPVHCLAQCGASPHAGMFVSVSGSGSRAPSRENFSEIGIWDLPTGKLMHTHQVHCGLIDLVANANGTLLISGCDDGFIRIWSVEKLTAGSHQTSLHVIQQRMALQKHIDCTSLSGGKSFKIPVWATPAQRKILTANKTLFAGSPAAVKAVLGVHDNDTTDVVAASSLSELRSQLENDEELRALLGQNLFAGDLGLESKFLVHEFTGHADAVSAVVLTSDGKYIVSGSFDQTIRVWSVMTHEMVRLIEAHDDFVTALAVSPDCRYIVSASDDKSIKVWSLDSGVLMNTTKHQASWISSVAISQDSKWLVSGSIDGTIVMAELGNTRGLVLKQIDSGPVSCLLVISNGKLIIVGDTNGVVHLLDAEQGLQVASWPPVNDHSNFKGMTTEAAVGLNPWDTALLAP